MDSNLKKFYSLSLKFLKPLNLGETYKFIVEEAMKLTHAKAGTLLLLENLELKHTWASEREFYKIKPRKGDLHYRSLKTQKPTILDTLKNRLALQRIFTGADQQTAVILPLFNQNKPLGLIVLISYKYKPFTEDSTGILKYFTPLAVNAIRRAQLYDESQKALEARNLFISMAAHELRTPLTTINGYAQLLYSKWSNAQTPESKWIEELTMECYRLTQLVNELLEANRIKTGQLHYVWTGVSLVEIANQALRDFRFTHPENKVILINRLKADQDKVIGDRNKLLQVILNLLDNAAKFSPPDQSISLLLANKKEDLILEITDRGSGIPPKELKNIFEMFYRGANHSVEGMGVGLFLAKNIITHHRGFISAKSKKDHGTSITVKLPMVKI